MGGHAANPGTFADLAIRLGRGPDAVRYAQGRYYFQVPHVSTEAITALPGCSVLPRNGRSQVFEVPVTEGTAVIAGTIRPERDGGQTIVDAWAVLRSRP